MAKKFLTPIGLVSLASDPASGSEGQLYFNTTDDVVKIYANGAWTELTGGGGGAISVSASAPVIATEGDGWFDNTDGKFYVYDGSFWVEAAQTDAVYASYNRWTKTLSASTSVISGVDDNGISLLYSVGLEQLFINGIFIDKSAYTASNGYSITLEETAYSGDLIEVLWMENLVIADTYSKSESDAKYLTIVNASSTYATITQLNNIDLTSAINTASTAAVNYLVDGAPGALDTLNELAAALDDNANILDSYLTQSSASSTYLTQSSASNIYLTQSSASTLYSLPSQTSNSGKYLTTNGSSASWSSVDALPSQTGNNGKYLTTNGASASWSTLDLTTKLDKLVTFDQEVASYELVLANADQIVEMNVGSANNLTVPLNSSQAFPIGTQITILQTGSGQTTIVPAVGVTINSTPGLKLRAQWSSALLIKRGTDSWVAIGDLSA